jgi:glucose-1-phosphate thymidylyltransferase
MNIIIPMAGRGSRLRPHTLTTAKPLLPVAGKPIVQRLVEDIAKIVGSDLNRIAYVVGDFGNEVETMLVDVATGLGAQGSIHYQEKPLGTAHAVLCAEDALEGPCVVAFADTLFRAKFQLDASADAVIWVNQVEDPRPFGVVKLSEDGGITDFVEKPQEFVSDLAIIGIYYFKDGARLKKELQYLIDHDIKGGGEYQLTHALENMKNDGLRMVPGQVDAWMDCGNKDVTVETNGRILDFVKKEETLVAADAVLENATILEPCFIGSGAKIVHATVGPYVSIGANSTVENSTLRDCIIGANTTIMNITLQNSMIGQHAHIDGSFQSLSLGDYSRLEG